MLARPEGVTTRPPPRVDPKREAFFEKMREQLILERRRSAEEADRRIEQLFQERAEKVRLASLRSKR